MREILFRGRRCCDKRWVYGNLIYSKQGTPYIYPSEVIEQDGHHLQFDTDEAWWVDPETIGEYTGLLDKNGAKIFEGDIVKADLDYNPDGRVNLIRKVIFSKGMFCLCCKKELNIYKVYGYHNIEVIANIHDNPELLEGDSDDDISYNDPELLRAN